jgi:UDP-N-acetylglucosamine 2-epimerase (non-hydrolysing)
LEDYRPDWVLTYGDTNSTLAAAVAAVKLHLPVAHLEAGLRSFNKRMPEEHNRVLTDHASDLLLAPTEVAMRHLAVEGLADRSVLVGDVMTDVLYATRDRVLAEGVGLPEHVEPGAFYVATLHRPDNTDNPARLGAIVEQLAGLPHPVLLLVHPRLAQKAADGGVALTGGSLRPIPPLAYPQLVAAVAASAGVVTDSGGLQKEAFLLRVPTTTVRPETEWVETVELGWNVLVDADLSILGETVARGTPEPTDATPYGDGRAAERVANALTSRRRV